MRPEKTIGQRIGKVFELDGLNINAAAHLLDMPQRTLNRQVNEGGNVTLNVVIAVLRHFPHVSPRWLLMGEGEMFNDAADNRFSVHSSCDSGSGAYYRDLPVSAGRLGVVAGEAEVPQDWCKMPGVEADFFFPVIGCSMEPVIMPGDIVGVVRADPLSPVDSDNIYMVVTTEERMIKQLKEDEHDNTLLWCISQNYPPFSIKKDTILYLYRVVFHGSLS